MVNVDPDDSCFTNSTVTGPVPAGRIPVTTPPVAAVTVAGEGVGTGVEGVIVTCSGFTADWPVRDVAVRTKLPLAFTVDGTDPFGGRSFPTPVMLTFEAPVVCHEKVVASGAQPLAGLAVKETMTGAVEKAPLFTARGMAVPSLVLLSLRMT